MYLYHHGMMSARGILPMPPRHPWKMVQLFIPPQPQTRGRPKLFLFSRSVDAAFPLPMLTDRLGSHR